MTSPRWALVKRDFESAAKHFGMAHAIHYDKAHGAVMGGYVQASAFMHAVQSGHTSLKSGLQRIFKTIGEPAPHDVDSWHEATVSQAFESVEGRPPTLPPELFEAVDETRRARNLAVRGYDAFDMGKAEATAEAAGRLAQALPSALLEFVARIDPPRRGGANRRGGPSP